MEFIYVTELITKRRVASSPSEQSQSLSALSGEIGKEVKQVFVDTEPSTVERNLILRSDRIKLIEELDSNFCKIHYLYESSDESQGEFSDYTTTYVVKGDAKTLFLSLTTRE